MPASPLRAAPAALALVLALVLGTPAAAPAASRPAPVFVGFRSPSGNIHCMHVSGMGPAELRCDVLQSTAPPVRAPASCELDYGNAFGLADRGRAQRLCVGDTVADPRNPVLGYGKTWKRGRITCTSSTAGIRCTNADQRGFTLSRSAQTIF